MSTRVRILVWLGVTGLVAPLAGCAKKQGRPPQGDDGALAPMAMHSPSRPMGPTPMGPTPMGPTSDRGGAGLRSPKWPAGYVLRKVQRLSSARVAQIARALGGRLVGVTNHFLAVGPQRFQVNVMEGVDEAAAKQVLAALMKRSSNGWQRYARRGSFVVEVFGGTPLLWHGVLRHLGLLDRAPRRYRLTARFGLLKSGNAADVNQLFNLVLQPLPADARWRALLAKLLQGLRFGTELALRNAPTAAGRPVYRFTPAPVKTRSSGAATRYEFGPVKRLHGVPYVDLVAEVPTRGWTPLAVTKPPGPALTAATGAWPTRAPKVVALVKGLGAGPKTPRARLTALHRWVHGHIRRGGRQGSRDGTLTVLARGFGRCGDSADVLITLARAAGLPARLVAGWVVGLGGHFWAEVYVAPLGWITVDATAAWLGAPAEYVPLMISEEGTLPLMHLRLPKIERLR